MAFGDVSSASVVSLRLFERRIDPDRAEVLYKLTAKPKVRPWRLIRNSLSLR